MARLLIITFVYSEQVHSNPVDTGVVVVVAFPLVVVALPLVVVVVASAELVKMDHINNRNHYEVEEEEVVLCHKTPDYSTLDPVQYLVLRLQHTEDLFAVEVAVVEVEVAAAVVQVLQEAIVHKVVLVVLVALSVEEEDHRPHRTTASDLDPVLLVLLVKVVVVEVQDLQEEGEEEGEEALDSLPLRPNFRRPSVPLRV